MRTVIATVVFSTITALAAQGTDPTAVLTEMRQALGGGAALDAVQSFSVSGTRTTRGGGFNHALSFEMFALLPDHFMTIARDSRPGGPLPVDVTYYNGFRGDELIRRTDSNIPFPPDPGPQTPAASAQRRREQTLKHKQDFARLALVLFGRSLISYPLQTAGRLQLAAESEARRRRGSRRGNEVRQIQNQPEAQTRQVRHQVNCV